jgi:ABC-type dipeptide/oligopeptide/nickel transport system permease subunit
MARKPTTLPNEILRFMRREPSFALGLGLMILILLVALFPQLFTSRSPTAIDTTLALRPPGAAHWFGTDDVGRDIFARTIHGTRITLSIVAGSMLISAVVGGVLGLISGFAGRWVDMAAGRAIDVVLSFPPIVLGVVISGVLGPSITNLVIALSVVYIPVFFRIARSGAISETGRTYVEAARSVGLTERAILFNHILRNVLPLILLQYMILFPLVLQIQAALGFLGLGVQPPTPDWGAILEQGKNYILFAPWISAFPGLFILISALAVTLIGRGIQKRMER